MSTIRVGIVGYGNVGRGVEAAIKQNPDMELVGVFTRRDPSALEIATPNVAAWPMADLAAHVHDVDVLILCGGSATDLPKQTPECAALYNVVDSFDTHAHIEDHFQAVDAAAQKGGTVAVISAGWDPGLFSLARVYAQAALPEGATYTFWGPGVSQGHSDAIRRIPGVLDARQYTIPVPASVEEVRLGHKPTLTTRQKHLRDCYVVAAEGADKQAIEQAIKTMPDYFADNDTTVAFITEKEMRLEHAGMPHGGFVIRTGNSANAAPQKIEYSLELASNPEFTGGVLCACARAAYRLSQAGNAGCYSMMDLAPSLLLPGTPSEQRAQFL